MAETLWFLFTNELRQLSRNLAGPDLDKVIR